VDDLGISVKRAARRSRGGSDAAEPLSVGPALVRTGTLLGAIYETHAREVGLTPQQARLLFVVVEQPANMLGLGSAVRLSKSTMTSLVDRMQELGLLERTPDPSDRRRLLVSATQRGIQVSKEFERGMRRSITRLTDQLNEVERTALARILSVLLAEGDGLLRSE
jgi:DNA-binding MarR family transcriptional regulator